MNNYPDAVAKIADDYLARVGSRLGAVPPAERDEFLRETWSHIYVAYQSTPGEDDVVRMLTALRNLGEPADMVANRLPAAMVRNGARRALPLQILGGVLIALFGIPLGLSGVGVIVGVLLALAGFLLAFYAFAGAFLFSSAVFLVVGLIRMYQPELWDSLVASGHIQINGAPFELLDQLSPPGQGFMFVLLALVLAGVGLGMLWLGKRFLRGLRFLGSLIFDWTRRRAQAFRERRRRGRAAAAPHAAWRPSVAAKP